MPSRRRSEAHRVDGHSWSAASQLRAGVHSRPRTLPTRRKKRDPGGTAGHLHRLLSFSFPPSFPPLLTSSLSTSTDRGSVTYGHQETELSCLHAQHQREGGRGGGPGPPHNPSSILLHPQPNGELALSSLQSVLCVDL